MKKVLYIIISLLIFWVSQDSFWALWDPTIKDWLIWATDSNVGSVTWSTPSAILWWLFSWFKTEIFSLVMVLAIWVFIFIGIRFASARWNPEEFKKAWMQLVYAILWIFFIFMAWWLVKIVASLRI